MMGHKLSRLVSANYFVIIPAISIALAVFVLGYVAFQYTPLGKAFYFERLSQQFPSGSVEAKRFTSISQALAQGKKTYTFHTKSLPITK